MQDCREAVEGQSKIDTSNIVEGKRTRGTYLSRLQHPIHQPVRAGDQTPPHGSITYVSFTLHIDSLFLNSSPLHTQLSHT